MDLVAFDHIAGVPIYYARQPVAPYGTKGKGPRVVRLDKTFKEQLERCLTDLWTVCQMGTPEALVSGGCYVEKAGRHGEGRAIDIDAIWWPGKPPLITKHAPQDAKRYLGVEAILRTHMGTILDYWYNSAHEDHWHCDNGSPPEWFPNSRARTVFLQAALTHVFGYTLVGGIDGNLGKSTRRALTDVLFSPDEQVIETMNTSTWLMFLMKVASAAFGN